MENTPLYRFEAVLKIGDCPVFNDIGGVFKEVAIKKFVYISHK
jgi:hypothetical protein